ncbi:MAG: lipid-A-disaccharide synthase [Alphaproteobacteria bacterium]|nr:lipid-A-disaccharide synthase [Alphaproteobacteria bacterium]
MSNTGSSPLVYLVALEPSGDALGARLITALRETSSSGVRIAGVGGEGMENAGLETLFDPSDLAILGIFEVIPKAGLVLRRVREVVADIERVKPDVLITIDSWGFTGRVHKALTKRGSAVKRVRCVAPQVWAWRPGRAKQLAAWIDHLITLFPFEPPLFEAHGLPSTWVGHPVIEDKSVEGDQRSLRTAHNIDENTRVLVVLPGSRKAEVKSLMPIFGDTINRLRGQFPNLHVVIPTIGAVESMVTAWAQSLPGPVEVVTGNDRRDHAFAVADVALAASGTVTLELARAGVPHVIAYKVNPVSAFVFKRLSKTTFVNLINVLLRRDVVPECLQDACKAEVLATEIGTLLTNEAARNTQKRGFSDALDLLRADEKPPSVQAAQVVLGLIEKT